MGVLGPAVDPAAIQEQGDFGGAGHVEVFPAKIFDPTPGPFGRVHDPAVGGQAAVGNHPADGSGFAVGRAGGPADVDLLGVARQVLGAQFGFEGGFGADVNFRIIAIA